MARLLGPNALEGSDVPAQPASVHMRMSVKQAQVRLHLKPVANPIAGSQQSSCGDLLRHLRKALHQARLLGPSKIFHISRGRSSPIAFDGTSHVMAIRATKFLPLLSCARNRHGVVSTHKLSCEPPFHDHQGQRQTPQLAPRWQAAVAAAKATVAAKQSRWGQQGTIPAQPGQE